MGGRRHWLWDGDCWCESRHHEGDALTFADPPWHASRDAEPVPSAVAW
jgi:hypothetical protein